MKTALIQMKAGTNKEENIRRAVGFVKQASSKGAAFILLPECFIFRGKSDRNKIEKEIAEEISGPSVKAFQLLAKELGIYLAAGSIYEKDIVRKKIYNTFDPA